MAVVFAATCWLRVILRPEVKTEAATGGSAAGHLSTAMGDLLRTTLPLSEETQAKGLVIGLNGKLLLKVSLWSITV